MKALITTLILAAAALMLAPGAASDPTTPLDPCGPVQVQTALGDCEDLTEPGPLCWMPLIWPPTHSTCQIGPVTLHCNYTWSFMDPPGIHAPKDADCDVDGGPAIGPIPMPHCTPILNPDELEAGAHCFIKNAVCIQISWVLIDEEWLFIGGGGCGATARFNGEAFLEEDHLGPIYIQLPQCEDLIQGEIFGHPICGFGWLVCPASHPCPPKPEPFPFPECWMTLEWPPSGFTCTAGPAEAKCTTQWTRVEKDLGFGGLYTWIPENIQCTAGTEQIMVRCTVLVDDDGWTGVACAPGGSDIHCMPVIWGIHAPYLIVGGYWSCEVIVATNPDELPPTEIQIETL